MEYLAQWLLDTNILVSIFGRLNLHTCTSISMQVSKASFSLMRTAMHLEHPRASTFLHLLDALVR